LAYTEVDEKQLVIAYQAGDERAFDAIVRTQWKALFTHALRRLNDPESAEDAVQDTLLRAYRALPSFSGDLALRAWLHRILTNVCYDEGNRRRRHAGLLDRVQNEPQLDVPDAAEEAILHDTVRVMASALQDLPDTYREALVLRYVDGLSFKEVADATGITEENARARVHRGRQALGKVLSRIAVVAGFLIPGLRRASQQTPATDAATSAATANADHVSLVTQLTSHAMNAAPTVSRLAAEASALPSGKSALLTGAIAAAAAVTVGGTAYTVHEVTQPTRRPPAAVAAPFAEKPAATTTTSIKAGAAANADDAGADDATTTTAPFETTSTLPPSAARPFAAGPVGDRPDHSTTTTSPPTTTPAPESGPLVEGTFGGDDLVVSGARPDFEVRGPSSLQGDDGARHDGQLDGRIYVADHIGGDASTELTFTLDDGRVLRVRFRGTLDRETTTDGAPTWTMNGRYSIPGGAAVGIAEDGTATVVFRDADGQPSSLSFDLQGHQPTS
jgi:RNA polymerase sigma-70 factor (ECF subfamily)